MDWKKWFSFYEGDNKSNHTQQKNSPMKGSKNVETRITYQYPKIQSNDIEIKQSIVPSRSKVGKKTRFEEDTYKLLEKNRKRRLANNEDYFAEDEELAVNHHREKVEDNKSKSKKRFRPTDIPSPIYGLHRKEKEKKEPIEFELSDIPRELPTKKDETIANREIDETIILHSENQSLGVERITSEVTDNMVQNEEVDILELVENGLEVNSSTSDQPNSLRMVEEDELIEESFPQKEKIALATPVEVREDSETINLDEVAVTVVEDEFLTDQSEINDKDPLPKEEQSTHRKTIPFNVMMLKKDREYLQRKSTIQTEMHTNNDTDGIQSGHYHFPSRNLLKTPVGQTSNNEWLQSQAEILNKTLKSFNVGANVVSVSEGPTVTRFEISPELGVKVNKITNLTDDLKLSLAARDIRIEAPIPGKHTIGIEVPNKRMRPVYLREILDKDVFLQAESPLSVALGLDISGNPIWTDLKKMPHGLIAGATGSGKSVCINIFLVSLLYKARPDQVKLLLIDPKVVELAPYNNIPHLISPVITDVKAATAALKWAVEEMERRYELFAAAGVRDISKFNEKDISGNHHLPYIVIVIDELADLMMIAPADVEEAIARIAQKARACGIHLLIATQRPSVDVITGLIKANVPTRIAFSVSSQIDSRTIIDMSGAERLLGKGDMLFLDNGTSKPVRLQGPFISDEEIEKVVEHVCRQGKPQYLFEQEELMKKADFDEKDDLLLEACEFAVQQGTISTSSLQRHFRIGYNRAARLIDMMEEKGMITESRGSKPRDVLITVQELEQLTEQLL